jgi:plastocyanin
VDTKSGGLQNVIVWLVVEQASAEVRGPPASLPIAMMDQRDHQFVPRVLAVRSGQPVRFTNSDPANHNVRTSSPHPANEFNVFTGADGSYTHRFIVHPAQRPVRVGCDIHPWMRGWIYVFDHPHFSPTDERGRFRIEAVPAGRYKLMLRQPDINYAHERFVTVSDEQPTTVEIEIRADSLRESKE